MHVNVDGRSKYCIFHGVSAIFLFLQEETWPSRDRCVNCASLVTSWPFKVMRGIWTPLLSTDLNGKDWQWKCNRKPFILVSSYRSLCSMQALRGSTLGRRRELTLTLHHSHSRHHSHSLHQSLIPFLTPSLPHYPLNHSLTHFLTLQLSSLLSL